MKIIIDNITNEDWDSNTLSELDYRTQWRSITKKLLQDTGIHLRSGEPSCILPNFTQTQNPHQCQNIKLPQHDGVVFALKLTDKDMFPPEDEDDMLDFLSSDTIDQLLYYVEQLLMTRDQLKQEVKRQRRRDHSVKTTTSTRITFSPPPPIAGFPQQATFYTPKREYTKKTQVSLHQ